MIELSKALCLNTGFHSDLLPTWNGYLCAGAINGQGDVGLSHLAPVAASQISTLL